MPTDDNSPSRRRREARWLLLVLVSALLAVGLGAVVLSATGQGAESTAGTPPASPARSSDPAASHSSAEHADANVRQDLPEKLRATLATRVAKNLEQASPIEHAGHGHHFAEGGKVLCAADPFGIEPPDATALGQVERAYVLHMCVLAEPGKPWDFSSRSSGPLVYTPGDPPSIEGPRPDRNYTEQVRELIPPRYHEQAFGTFADVGALTELRKRFNAIS